MTQSTTTGRLAFDPARFRAVPLVGILRGLKDDFIEGVLGALAAGGLTHLEFTFDDPERATRHLTAASHAWGARLHLGAGTITTRDRLQAALAAGATFVVTPGLHWPVINDCLARGVPVFPGVFSPSEAAAAWERGVRWVKLFPADAVGPRQVTHFRQMLPQLGVMPTGGVTLESVRAWRRAGAGALGLGSPLLQSHWIRQRDWESLRAQASAFVRAWQDAACGADGDAPHE